MKLVIFSICLNEGKNIGRLLKAMPKRIKGIKEIETIVVDDGSKDRTSEIAKKNGALVFSNREPKKLAYSFQFAVDKALELGADIVVNIDGDMQFNPKDIPILIAPILAGKADFVAGNRFIDPVTKQKRRPKNMPLLKYWGNKLGARVVSAMSGKKFEDVTCGFRAYNRKALMHLNINSKHTYTQESFQVLAAKKIDILQLPINVTYFPGRKSRVVSSVLSFISISGSNIIRAYRDYRPLAFFGTPGTILTAIGASELLFSLIFFLVNGTFSPYKYIGLSGIYVFSLGLLLWILALIADMFDRVVGNQEKIIYMLKEQKYLINTKKANVRHIRNSTKARKLEYQHQTAN